MKAIIVDLINRRSHHRRSHDSFRRSTADVINTRDDTQRQTTIDHSGKSKSISSLQEPSPTIIDADVNTTDQQSNSEDHKNNSKFISSAQEPQITLIETNVNTPEYLSTNEIDTSSEISTTNNQTPNATNSWNDDLKFTQKTMLKTEMQLSVLRSYADCELSTLTSKFDMFPDSLKNALGNLQSRGHENSNIDVLQQNIAILLSELRSKDNIIKSLLETQRTLTSSLSNPKTRLPETVINLSQHQHQQHQEHQHHHQQHSQNQLK